MALRRAAFLAALFALIASVCLWGSGCSGVGPAKPTTAGAVPMTGEQMERADLTDIAFRDANKGWIVGWVRVPGAASQGVLLSTFDGGRTWSGETTSAWAPFAAIDLWEQDSGWIACGDTRLPRDGLLRTTDGGRTWQGVGAQFGGHSLSGVAALGPDRAVAVDLIEGTALRTDDGGLTFRTQVLETDLNLQCVSFSDALNGWAAGWYWSADGLSQPLPGLVFRTTDGGRSWKKVRTPVFRSVQALASPERGVAWIATAGDPYGLLVTRDGGATWKRSLVRVSGGRSLAAMDVHFFDARRGWVVGMSMLDPQSDMPRHPRSCEPRMAGKPGIRLPCGWPRDLAEYSRVPSGRSRSASVPWSWRVLTGRPPRSWAGLARPPRS